MEFLSKSVNDAKFEPRELGEVTFLRLMPCTAFPDPELESGQMNYPLAGPLSNLDPD